MKTKKDREMKRKGYRYKIEYFDPADPEAEAWKVWYYKTHSGAKERQDDLRTVWKESAKHFPIRKI